MTGLECSGGFLSAIFGIFGKFCFDIGKTFSEHFFFDENFSKSKIEKIFLKIFKIFLVKNIGKIFDRKFSQRFLLRKFENFQKYFFRFLISKNFRRKKNVVRKNKYLCRTKIFQRFQKSHLEMPAMSLEAPTSRFRVGAFFPTLLQGSGSGA